MAILIFFSHRGLVAKVLNAALTEKTSIKDVIESCGVPHPEVGLILVNGKALDFDYGLTRDAQIEVYPPETGYPHFEDKHSQIATIIRFVTDGHLGKLMRNLRLLGFDVAYDCRADDRELLGIMEAEDRRSSLGTAGCSCMRWLKRLLPAFPRPRRTNDRGDPTF